MAEERRKTWKHFRRADKNQSAVVAYLRRFHVRVAITNQVGFGFPDLVCSFQGYNFLVEVKQPGRQLRPDQVKFHNNWDGPIHMVETGTQALQIITAYVAAADPRWTERAKELLGMFGAAGAAEVVATQMGGAAWPGKITNPSGRTTGGKPSGRGKRSVVTQPSASRPNGGETVGRAGDLNF